MQGFFQPAVLATLITHVVCSTASIAGDAATQPDVAKHRAMWDQAAAAVRSSAVYQGLELRPQAGLVPLGMDPQSQLQEFLHLETHEGDLPVRGADGRIAMSGNTGIIFVLIPPGPFWMGSQSTDPHAPNFDEHAEPGATARRVDITAPYFISKY